MSVQNDQEDAQAPQPQVPLALSILSHRNWCRDCQVSADQISAALYGARLEDLTPNWDEAA